MYRDFRAKLEAALAATPESGRIHVELSTLGGDPEVARMMGEDIRFHSDLAPGRRFVFLGKAAIYSAGTTFMSFFAIENRYLTRGTRLMVHERKLSKTLQIEGPLTTCIASVKATLHESRARSRSRMRVSRISSAAARSQWRTSSRRRQPTGISKPMRRSRLGS
jgi:hypothetical protein